MGDVFFDLASFSLNNDLDRDGRRQLLEAYVGSVRPADERALALMLFMSDFREAMWGARAGGGGRRRFRLRGARRSSLRADGGNGRRRRNSSPRSAEAARADRPGMSRRSANGLDNRSIPAYAARVDPYVEISVDRDAGPLHVAIAEQLAAAIASGRLAAGERLPPERRLAESLGVSRMTVRQALGELERDGLLRRVVGRTGGTFVREPDEGQRRRRRSHSRPASGTRGASRASRWSRPRSSPRVDERVCPRARAERTGRRDRATAPREGETARHRADIASVPTLSRHRGHGSER